MDKAAVLKAGGGILKTPVSRTKWRNVLVPCDDPSRKALDSACGYATEKTLLSLIRENHYLTQGIHRIPLFRWQMAVEKETKSGWFSVAPSRVVTDMVASCDSAAFHSCMNETAAAMTCINRILDVLLGAFSGESHTVQYLSDIRMVRNDSACANYMLELARDTVLHVANETSEIPWMITEDGTRCLLYFNKALFYWAQTAVLLATKGGEIDLKTPEFDGVVLMWFGVVYYLTEAQKGIIPVHMKEMLITLTQQVSAMLLYPRYIQLLVKSHTHETNLAATDSVTRTICALYIKHHYTPEMRVEDKYLLNKAANHFDIKPERYMVGSIDPLGPLYAVFRSNPLPEPAWDFYARPEWSKEKNFSALSFLQKPTKKQERGSSSKH